MDLIERNILQINNIVRQTFPHNPDINATQEKLSETKKFLIVRHPIERLVSAYRDKLERIEGREYYYKRFGRHIAYKYHSQKLMNKTELEPPSFIEFLRFIVEEKYFDEHWAPFYDTCKPCNIDYDYILKFDTFDRDQRFLIYELGLNKYLYQENDLRNANSNGPTTSALVKQYLKDIPRVLLTQINKVYEKDFMLFSYSLP
ncbi:hypothetical protein KM043_018322 [Ampulex compressa]|nr:hypothetical protein KM043_018322 [Ampulex compressa]